MSGLGDQIPAAGSGLRTCGVGTLVRIGMGNREVWNSGSGQEVEVKNPGLLFPAWGTFTNYSKAPPKHLLRVLTSHDYGTEPWFFF